MRGGARRASRDAARDPQPGIEATVYPPGEPPHDVTIVDDVSLTFERGKVLGLIGESGAGKSTIGLAVDGPLAAAACRITGGEVMLNGTDIRDRRRRRPRKLRGNERLLCRPERRRPRSTPRIR